MSRLVASKPLDDKAHGGINVFVPDVSQMIIRAVPSRRVANLQRRRHTVSTEHGEGPTSMSCSRDITYRVTRGAHLLHLPVQPDGEPAQDISETVIRVPKHDDRLDSTVQGDGDIARGRMHDARTLGVADQSELLIRARNGLVHEAVHDIGGTLQRAGDDVGAGGILSIQS